VADDQPTPSGPPDDDTGAPPSDADMTVPADGTAKEPPGSEPPASDPDATQIVPDPDAIPDPDATQIVPDPDATRGVPAPDPDATQIASVPDPDATQVVPPTPAGDEAATQPFDKPGEPPTQLIRPQAPDPTAALPPVPPTWRGQFGVQPPGPDDDRTGTWTEPPPSSGRAWWLPILVGVVGLLVLVGVAFALVAAMRNTSTPAPNPSATTPTPSPVPASSTAAPSPTVSSPPATPSASPNSFITLPSTWEGLLFTDVEHEINGLGLKYTLQPQVDSSVLPNTVINTIPAPGNQVVPGTTITIIYAAPPPPSPSSDPSPSVSPSH
jgi:hypothetical protein